MFNAQSEEEILKQRRIDDIQSHGNTITGLQLRIRELEGNIKHLEAIFTLEYSKKIESLVASEEEIKLRMNDIEDKYSLANSNLKESELKLNKIKEKEAALVERENNHNEFVNASSVHIENQKDLINIKNSNALDIEDRAKYFLLDSQNKMSAALAKEKDIEEKANKLVHIQNNINEDIVNKNNIQENINVSLYELNDKKLSIEKQALEVEKIKSDAVKMKDEIDITTARLSQRKSELDEKDKRLKEMSIRNEVISQKHAEKDKDLIIQESKLRQLKSDLDILLKQKESNEIKEA